MFLGEVVPAACNLASSGVGLARQATRGPMWPWSERLPWERQAALIRSAADRLEEAARLMRAYVQEMQEALDEDTSREAET
jgi:hypothetical protein